MLAGWGACGRPGRKITSRSARRPRGFSLLPSPFLPSPSSPLPPSPAPPRRRLRLPEGGSGKGRRRNADCGANATELQWQPKSGVGEGGRGSVRAGGVEEAGLQAKFLQTSHGRKALQSSLHSFVPRASSEKGIMFARGMKPARATRKEKRVQCHDWWLLSQCLVCALRC